VKFESSSSTPLVNLNVTKEESGLSVLRSSIVDAGAWIVSIEVITRLGVVTRLRAFPGRKIFWICVRVLSISLKTMIPGILSFRQSRFRVRKNEGVLRFNRDKYKIHAIMTCMVNT
jgi:hypothetical protein